MIRKLPSMGPETKNFLIDFQRNCDVNPIRPDDPRYIQLYSYELGLLDDDPILALIDTMEVHSRQSVQLLSGYRGTGKTTELNRMTALLRERGYVTAMFDIEDYLSPGKPVELIEFLLGFAGALSDACETQGINFGPEGSIWDRTLGLLKRIKLEEVSIGVPQTGAELKVAIKESSEFTARLRKYMTGRLGELVLEVRAYVDSIRNAMLSAFPESPGFVVVVDSIEHFRGTASTEDEVQQSIERLFGENADTLHFAGLHVVYTVPPYLRVRVPNVGERFEPGLGIQMLPTIKVRNVEGLCQTKGVLALRSLVAARGDWTKVMTTGQLDRLCEMSGGHLRDLMRMMQDLVRRLRQRDLSKATDVLITDTIEAATREMLPIADDDAEWLWRIHLNHEFPLPSIEQLPRLSRFLDTHVILCYRNGKEWYDIHPLIQGDVERQVKRLVANG
jgi:hypothetical protein